MNFNGHVSFLEYLLYQYREFANPADFIERSMAVAEQEEYPAITKARQALEEVSLSRVYIYILTCFAKCSIPLYNQQPSVCTSHKGY